MERPERAALYIFIFGVGLNMVAVAGPLAFPSAPVIVWRCILFGGVIITILSGVFLVYEYRHLIRSARMIPLIGMVVCGFGFAGFATWYFWPRSISPGALPSAGSPSPNKNDSRKPLSMRQLFDSDFVGLAKIAMQSNIKDPKGDYVFAYSQYLDIPTNSFFLAFFLSRTEVNFINIVSCRISNIIGQLGDTYFTLTTPGDTRTITTDSATFSKQIFLYLDDNPSIKEMAEIEEIFSSRGYSVSFRTADYKVMHWQEWNRDPKGAEKGPMVVLPHPEAGMQIYATNRYSPARDWFKGPPVECHLPPELPNKPIEK